MTAQQELKIVSRAWGKQRGYCFFPYIEGSASNKEERIRSYHEGPAFLWPRDEAKILDHLDAHTKDDQYWCPSLFEKPLRKMELAMDEHCLWADLDEVDPRGIQEYPPTIAWETSPGRYQALWLITGGLMGASWMGNENQQLTYYVGADVSGWDTTQLLRIPGRPNHKFTYWQNGTKEVPGQVLWTNGRRYLPDDFVDLPEVQSAVQVSDILEGEVDNVDRHEVWGRVRLRVSKRVRDFISARETSGDRSEVLWEIERELADAGCTVVEVVAIVRGTVWNKYSGRQDELRRLTIEAAKAHELKASSTNKSTDGALEEQDLEDRGHAEDLWTMLENVKQPEWLIKDILAAGACGFIAGQPKTHKSWIGLDLILSVSTGIPFLNHFPVRKPGPVLYIQEEDSAPMVKSRIAKVWPGKRSDKMKIDDDGNVEWHPPSESDRPPVKACIRKGIVLSDPAWQSWLEEELSIGCDGEPFVLLVIDPLMMVAGDVDENRSQEMTTKIFKPLKTFAETHGVAVLVVHHMRKGESEGKRGGQMMLGSVANHAWSEDSLYIWQSRGQTIVERESKHSSGGSFKITGLRSRDWNPGVTDDQQDEDERPERTSTNHQRKAQRVPRALQSLRACGGHAPTKVIAEHANLSTSGIDKQLKRLEAKGTVEYVKVGNRAGVWKETRKTRTRART